MEKMKFLAGSQRRKEKIKGICIIFFAREVMLLLSVPVEPVPISEAKAGSLTPGFGNTVRQWQMT